MNLGQRIAMLRGRRSQKNLAAAAGIDAATLNRIERGTSKNPSRDTLEALAGALGVSVGDLTDTTARIVFGFEREEQPPQASLPEEPEDIARLLNSMRIQLRDAMNIAWNAQGASETALARADKALVKADAAFRQSARRGRRSA